MYFDYAATTPPNDEVLATFDAVTRDFWANPHALHRPGLRAESMLERSREQVLELLGAEKDFRCVFTSGATEANNMAIKGVARLRRERGQHLITSAVEHPSVLEVLRFLDQEGFEVTVLPVNTSGAVEPDSLREALRPDTTLVSLMHINNEVGAINDIAALGRVIKEGSSALFHVDAAQSVGKYSLDMDEGAVDLLSFSAHKFFGLKGSGALILKKRIELPMLLHGGGQESGFRSGTADTARAASLAKALRLALENHEAVFEKVKGFRQSIVNALQSTDGVELNGALEGTSPFIINASISGVKPETLLTSLADQEIYISTVSACLAQKTSESRVVQALTGDHERSSSSIRISLAACTTQEEVDALCAALGSTIETIRMERK